MKKLELKAVRQLIELVEKRPEERPHSAFILEALKEICDVVDEMQKEITSVGFRVDELGKEMRRQHKA